MLPIPESLEYSLDDIFVPERVPHHYKPPLGLSDRGRPGQLRGTTRSLAQSNRLQGGAQVLVKSGKSNQKTLL